MIANIHLRAPLTHGDPGLSGMGNMSLIRRAKIGNLPGLPEVPQVSGNALRGKLRRMLMRDTLDFCGLTRALFEEGGKAREWDRLYGALVNGGALKGKETRLKPEEARELREAIPPLSILGAAIWTTMLSGRLSVGPAWPVCAETVQAGLCEGDALAQAWDLVEEASLVRHIDHDQMDASPEGADMTPMPYTFETLSAGVTLQSHIGELARLNDIEWGCVAHGLDLIDHLGGKGASGYGRVVIEHDGDAQPWLQWREANKERLTAALVGLAERLAKA